MKRLLILIFLLSSLLFAGDLVVYNEDGTLTCNTDGIAYIASTQAYGEWEFDFNKNGVSYCTHIINNAIPLDDGYAVGVNSNNSVFVGKITAGSLVAFCMLSSTSYVANNTDYRIKITRSLDHHFTAYIQGGSFGESWTLVDASVSGNNPSTTHDTDYTTSSYFVADLDAGDKISKIHLTNGNLDVRDFTISTGAFSTSGTWFTETHIVIDNTSAGNIIIGN